MLTISTPQPQENQAYPQHSRPTTSPSSADFYTSLYLCEKAVSASAAAFEGTAVLHLDENLLEERDLGMSLIQNMLRC
jgi:hypothetical protein